MGNIAYLPDRAPEAGGSGKKLEVQGGFTPLPNDINSALCQTRLAGRQQRVINVIIDKTVRWHKSWDRIALTTFADRAGIGTKHLPEIIRTLEFRKIIRVQRFKDGRTNLYQLNPNTDEWVKVVPRKQAQKGTPKNGSTPPQKGSASPETGENYSQKRETHKNSFQNNLLKEKEEKLIRLQAEVAALLEDVNPEGAASPVELLTVSEMPERELSDGSWGRFELTSETYRELHAEWPGWYREFDKGSLGAVSEFLDSNRRNHPSLRLTAEGWQAWFKGFVRNRMAGVLPSHADVGPDGFGFSMAVSKKY